MSSNDWYLETFGVYLVQIANQLMDILENGEGILFNLNVIEFGVRIMKTTDQY